ncbi:hypothetical protein MNB_SV-12-1247 [hydrothermal vent metagenome]|uniref:Uncharacterized protein n=1 Tax=hydrothermal vent metagenome TaxID=652676 RepID=A0A1W1C294_9ZZZZ
MIIGREEELLKKILNNYKLNNNNIILYPIYNKDKIELEKILIISSKDGIISININSQIIEENTDFLELILFIKEVEEFLLLEDGKIIEEKLKDFNSQYMTIATPILDMIFEVDGDLKILRAKVDFDSFMEKYRYEALEYGLYFLSETILPTVPKDTKKIYLATTSGLNKMSSYTI